MAIIDVVIPAFNEEESISKVINDLPKEILRHIVVGNNGSTDNTASEASKSGATVVDAPQKGYGNACLHALDYISKLDQKPDIVVFIDGDYSDYPKQLKDVIRPIIDQDMDMVIGSRARGNREKGSMTIPQLFGNWLATNLIRIIYKVKFTDLGPFRAIKWNKLQEIDMQDRDFGWTVEMQIKAAKFGLKSCEVPVDYKKRIGISKVSGTIKGAFSAGVKILYLIFKML